MVQYEHQAEFPQVEDGVDVQVELGGIVLFGKESLAKDRTGAESTVGEDDVATQVVPTGQVAEGDHPADTRRLAVPHADLGRGIDLDDVGRRSKGPICHSSSSKSAIARSGVVPFIHGAPEGHARGWGRKSRRLTRSL